MANIINTGSTNCPFPVGYGGFFQSDPNSIYAGTTWEQKKDVFILASGDSYKAGSTGGEATHTLTTNEMPRHEHPLSDRSAETTTDVDLYKHQNYKISGFDMSGMHYIQSQGKDNPHSPTYTYSTGGGAAHNNMPPYYSMPFWIRTE